MHDGDWQADHVQDVLTSYYQATQYNQEWYKAWHSWALANFEVVTALTSNQSADVPPFIVSDHVVPAIKGFFKSIALSSMSSLQDTLRLLTLWFAHGSHQEVTHNVQQGISSVSVDTWLEVMPQLIARINQPNRLVREAIHNLLVDVGRAHPQALVYPLTVSMKSDLGTRSRSAGRIMEAMRQHSPNLVEQAGLVSHELIRIAVLWHEQWHEGLEEASRLYFGDHNIEGMLATLEPLHEMLRKGPETLREISFIQSFGRDLAEAKDWCEAYKTTREIGDLNQVSAHAIKAFAKQSTDNQTTGMGSLLRRIQTYRQAAATINELGVAICITRTQDCSRPRSCGAWYISKRQGDNQHQVVQSAGISHFIQATPKEVDDAGK